MNQVIEGLEKNNIDNIYSPKQIFDYIVTFYQSKREISIIRKYLKNIVVNDLIIILEMLNQSLIYDDNQKLFFSDEQALEEHLEYVKKLSL